MWRSLTAFRFCMWYGQEMVGIPGILGTLGALRSTSSAENTQPATARQYTGNSSAHRCTISQCHNVTIRVPGGAHLKVTMPGHCKEVLGLLGIMGALAIVMNTAHLVLWGLHHQEGMP